MWAHRPNMRHLEALTTGFEVNIFEKKAGKKSWENLYRLPRVGLSIHYLNYGKPEITGSVIGVLPFAEFVIFESKKTELCLRTGSGLGYFTKKWNLQTNNLNNAIGSVINGNMRIQALIHQKIAKKYELNFGLGITHYSNGSYKLPNLGLNNVEALLGLGLWNQEHKMHKPDVKPIRNAFVPRNYWEAAFLLSTKQSALTYPHRVFPVGFQAAFVRHHKPKSIIGIGLDFFIDKDNFVVENLGVAIPKATVASLFQTGIKVKHEMPFYKVSLITEMAYVLVSESKRKGNYYQRIGFRFLLNENLYLQTTLKTIFVTADFFEFGLAYRFKKKKLKILTVPEF